MAMRLGTTHSGRGAQIAAYLLCLLFLSTQAAAQGVARGTRIDLTAKLQLNSGAGQFAQLFVPDYYWPTPIDSFMLVVHLHSASWAAEDQVYRSNTNAILVNIHLGALSSPYQSFFANQSQFQRILDTTLSVLRSNNIMTQPRIARLIMTSFSAGYAGVREILKTYAQRIHALTLADGLHSNSDSATMRVQMQDFLTFARSACARQKVFLLTHSSIPTSGYESTTATANYLLQNLGIPRIAHSAVDTIGTQYSRADSGHFHLKGYLGTTAPDHLRHLYGMHLMLGHAVRLLDSVITSVEENDVAPEGFRLEQNFPNPFNPETTIRFSMPAAGPVALRVFDSSGRIVATLLDDSRGAGQHAVRWNATSFASGAYFYRLQSHSYSLTRKLLLLR